MASHSSRKLELVQRSRTRAASLAATAGVDATTALGTSKMMFAAVVVLYVGTAVVQPVLVDWVRYSVGELPAVVPQVAAP